MSVEQVKQYIDTVSNDLVARLGEAVAIPSVSSDLISHGKDCVRMGEYVAHWIERLGGTVHYVTPEKHHPEDPELPPIILGSLGNDHSKPTVALYGHYDVQPANQADGWATDPWKLTEKDGKLFGRGSTDDKGPLLSWLWVIEAFQKVGREIPINIKFCFEGMEESGSVGLEKVVQDECKPGKFFSDVDYFCISDNYWLGSRKPCVTYGLRGMAYFFLEIEGPGQDLHSGLFGGVVHEPMVDLVHLFSKLVDSDGKILVPNIHDSVRPVTPEEMKTYESIDFDPEEFRKVVGSQKLSKTGKTEILQHRWRFPSLSIHGVEGAFSGSGSKTVIPKKVVGKFSFRLVPDQDPKDIEKHVQDYLKKEFAKLKSPNKMNVQLFHGARAWLSPTDHPNYEAARKAIKEVFGVEPDLTREGGSIPIVLTFQEASGKNVLLLPVGCADDGAHSQNEKFNRVNYINGCKLLAHYFEEIAKAGKTSTAQKRALETKDSSESPKKRKQ